MSCFNCFFPPKKSKSSHPTNSSSEEIQTETVNVKSTETQSDTDTKIQSANFENSNSNSNTRKTRILIIYYSTWGHVKSLAESEGKGASSFSSSIEVRITQIPETLPQDVLEKLHAAPRDINYPNATYDDLKWSDGILVGLPTRFGTTPGQFKAWWDGTGQLWKEGALAGKPFGLFFSTASQGGGQESTAFTTLPNFLHHGMIFVANGYPDSSMFDLQDVHGGSAYGSGTFAGGDGSRQPSKIERNLAEIQGKNFAKFARLVKIGREQQIATK